MTEVWAVPGYDVQALIGFGATGEVWRARELATGDEVALKRLRAGADVQAVEALRREAAVLRTLDTPYVVRLRALLGEGPDTVLVLDLAEGGSLAALLARRGTLDAAEVVTIAAPLAQALAAAHACGLVHGDVSPANILFTADGMPLLADLGLVRLAGESLARVEGTAEYVDPAVAAGAHPGPASDVWALAAVCHQMLCGAPPHEGSSAREVLDAARDGSRAPLGLLAPLTPRPLVSAIEAALQGDPALRPDAASFAASVRRSHAAAPVRLSDGVRSAVADVRATDVVRAAASTPTPLERRQLLPRRAVVLSGVAVLVLCAAVAVGWWSGRAAPEGGASVSAASAVSAAPIAVPAREAEPTPDWVAVLDGLDAARADAFRTADVAALTAVYAPGSTLLPADRAAVERLRAHGWRANGVRHTVVRVAVTSSSARVTTLRVTDRLASYDVVDNAGRIVQRTAPRPDASFLVTVVRTGHGWRLQQVVPA